LWREILHHYHVSTLCTATPGCGDLLLAAFDLGVPSVALCKNAAHVLFLQKRLAKHILMSTMDEASTHYQSDYALAKSCELSERVLASAKKTSKVEEAEPADEGAEGEDGEEEEEGEGDEEGEEEEEEAEEEEAAEKEVASKKAPARKPKKEVEAKAKSQAKAGAEPKAKGKAKGEAEPKAKGKAKAKPDEKKEDSDDEMLKASPPQKKAKGKAKSKAAAAKEAPTKRGTGEAIGGDMTPKTKRNKREVEGGGTGAAPLAKNLGLLRARLGLSGGTLSSLPRL
jgi:hypothetical protein